MTDITSVVTAGNPPAGGVPPVAAPGAAPVATGGVVVAPAAVGAPPVAPATFSWDPNTPKEHMDLAIAKGFDKNPSLLLGSYYNSNKALSGATDVLIIPADGNLDTVYDKLGRPKTPDLYEFKFGDGVVTDPNMTQFGKTFFHKLGVPATKAQEAVEMWQTFALDQNAKAVDKARTENDAAVTALKTSLGNDVFTASVANAQAAFQNLGVPADVLNKVEAAIGGAPMLQLLAAIGSKIPKGEAPTLGGNTGTGTPLDPSQMTGEQAQAAKIALDSDPAFQAMYLKADHPGHKGAVDKMLALNNQIMAARQKR